jgi:hypothetical protein
MPHRKDAENAELFSFILLSAETPKSKMIQAFGHWLIEITPGLDTSYRARPCFSRPRTECEDCVAFHRRPLNGDGKIQPLCDLCGSSEALLATGQAGGKDDLRS